MLGSLTLGMQLGPLAGGFPEIQDLVEGREVVQRVDRAEIVKAADGRMGEPWRRSQEVRVVPKVRRDEVDLALGEIAPSGAR
ncbi:hypothetical protein [Methylobacterium sp. WL8]|uniref:hypothetical protein n=1 Tax=Methylobacterium sp. WL8 TaxID=2603899 RepID=UPI0011CA5DDB|nr:hypothetical protein [Methylobacterium sp. WL8]TXN76683.1 hypothetical protein FV234_24450 [Methylobacterium sp. WL8]